MATHSSIPAWRIPVTEEPGRLQSRDRKSWTGLATKPPPPLPSHIHINRNTHIYIFSSKNKKEFLEIKNAIA